MDLNFFVYKRYAVVAKYGGNSNIVVVPPRYKGVPVTEIRAGAFAGKNVEGVIIPETLQVIEDNAFDSCQNLRYIGYSPGTQEEATESFPVTSVLPLGLRSIGSFAFKGTALRNVEFRSKELELGDSAFENCRFINELRCFECDSLKLGTRVFMNSSIGQFYAPKVRINMVPEYAFANCVNLTTVVMHICGVGERSFYQCKQLSQLFTSKQFRCVGCEAFAGCDCFTPPGKASPRRHSGKVPDQKSSPGILQSPDPELLRQRTILLGTLHKIEKNAKELKNMYDKIPDNFQPVSDNPLFSMNIGNPDWLSAKIPPIIKGSWTKVRAAYYFAVELPSALAGEKFSVSSKGQSDVVPLLDYIIKNKASTILQGEQRGDRYTVLAIHPAASDDVFAFEIPRPFFYEMVERLRRPVPSGLDLGSMLPPFAMRNEAEYETFIEVCKGRLPAWVINAYHKNKEVANRRMGGFSDDDRKHARRAMELLMNIDWLPHTVNVPTSFEARQILDDAFYGLNEVKDRVEEIVAQIRRTGKLPKWGILLHGPAGTGKTSIAKAIARMMQMELIQMDMSSLGDDPDEVSGSSRIYNNARPGMLLESMYQIRSSTAVLLANEIDKAGNGRSGHIASDILLTILDKTGFYENFLEEVIPTDNLFCIGTCNDLSKVSKPLQDRFLIIDIPGYTAAEKKVIFRDYVFPLAKKKANIPDDQMGLKEDALELLTSEYALEPGARDLEQYAERFIGDYCRHVVNKEHPNSVRVYTTQDVRELFGPGKNIVRNFAINPGMVNSAYYHDGMAHFFLLEASIMPGSGKFEVLGPVSKMQAEYCKVAYWCVRSTTNAAACDLSKQDVTVFISQALPDGAGNHVGLACYAAICSKIMNRNLALRQTAFIGGCTLDGSLYFDHNDLTPLLLAMKARGVSVLYAPMGTSRLIDAKVNCECGITVIEGPDAMTLFSLAVTHSNNLG